MKYDVETYLGIKFENLPGGDVKLTQPKLLKSLFKEYEEELRNHRVREPITPQRSINEEPMDPAAYLHLEGALIYLTKSRPDIHTAVSFGATHSVKPTRGDFEELIHCLKYLEATQEEGLILKAGESNRDLILKCYVDASRVYAQSEPFSFLSQRVPFNGSICTSFNLCHKFPPYPSLINIFKLCYLSSWK